MTEFERTISESPHRIPRPENLEGDCLPAYTERHYTVTEVATLWNLSPDSVRVLFQREPGVLILGNQVSTRKFRRYTTLRIPESVLARVHRRMLRV